MPSQVKTSTKHAATGIAAVHKGSCEMEGVDLIDSASRFFLVELH